MRLVAGGSASRVGTLLSWVFHPLWVTPIAVFALAFAAVRDAATAARWTAAASVCLVPGLGWWTLGLSRGWWTDPDLSERTERRGPFAFGVAGAVVFAVLARGFPAPLPWLAAVGALAALAGAGATGLGLKISGHVAIPAALGLAMWPWSATGPWLLVGPAVALSWARVAAARHRGVEVLAAWGLAAVVAGLAGA